MDKLNATLAAEALKASIRFSSELVGIVELINGTGRGGLRLNLSDLNRTATIAAMRHNVERMQRFVESMEAAADAPREA